MAIELTNGKKKETLLAFDIMPRIYPITPDMSQWEVKCHVLADLGMGKEVLVEMTLRSFNGGIAPLEGTLPDCFKNAKEVIQKASAMLRQMQEQQNQRIIQAKTLPKDMN